MQSKAVHYNLNVAGWSEKKESAGLGSPTWCKAVINVVRSSPMKSNAVYSSTIQSKTG